MGIVFQKRKNTSSGAVSGRPGFTLLETMFAILIVSIGILGIHNGMNFAIRNTQKARENFVGTYLAQEGIEIVKNVRDNNWINDNTDSTDWLIGLDVCSSGCYADYQSASLTPGEGDFLRLNSDGFYGYSSDPDPKTIYKRKITIAQTANPDELDVTVDVSWKGVTTTVKENIYNWYMPAP